MELDELDDIERLHVIDAMLAQGCPSALAAVLGLEIDTTAMTREEAVAYLNRLAETILRERAEKEAVLLDLESATQAIEEKEQELVSKDKELASKDKELAKANSQAASYIEAFQKSHEKCEMLEQENKRLKRELETASDSLAAERKEKYGSKSAKTKKAQADESDSKGNRAQDDFDGSEKSKDDIDKNGPDNAQSEAPEASQAKKADNRPRGKGSKGSYSTMEAEIEVYHPCDLSQLPAGATLLGYEEDVVFDLEIRVASHKIQYVVFEMDGKQKRAHYEYKDKNKASIVTRENPHLSRLYGFDDPDSYKSFQGTGITPRFMSFLSNLYFGLSVPAYRFHGLLSDLGMRFSRGTPFTWFEKGMTFIEPSIEALKDMAITKDAIVNCDETWCKVKMKCGKYKKEYIWVLVNRELKIVIFFYDNGSRGRKVLKEFLGDKSIKALQSDGYNAYTYLNGSLTVDHIDCMAHARAKIKLAADLGDPIAKKLLKLMNWLFGREAEYKEKGLSPDEIYKMRNDAETTEKILEMYQTAKTTLDDEAIPKSDKMEKALKYLINQWSELMAYRKDGRYQISNNIAEREIRGVTVFRKNVNTVGSNRGAERLSAYRSFINTCKNLGHSIYGAFMTLFAKQYDNDDECKAGIANFLFSPCFSS